jgi:transposase
MTESEVFESILGINEIQVDRVEWQDQSLHIYCSSIFSEALCPNCLNKRQVINQIYERKFRDLPITGKEVYLHLQRFIAGCCGICPVKPVLPHQEG